jgi:hypothetical protein
MYALSLANAIARAPLRLLFACPALIHIAVKNHRKETRKTRNTSPSTSLLCPLAAREADGENPWEKTKMKN